ncbi:MAG: lipid-A-disaccharide synthase [Flavobacteriales bacterium]
MKYYIISGEASGDMHGANLISEMKKLDASATFRGWGGDKMEEQGMTLVKHYKELAFMGFAEVIMNLRTILGNIKFCKKDLLDYKPDAVILIDYPGFNLRIAEFLHDQGIKVFFYISPQVWAWKQSRVKKIKKVVDHLFVILPFEKPFYEKFNYHVDFVGNPLLDEIGKFKKSYQFEDFRANNNLDERPIIALLPGSRNQEINTKLPLMLSVVEKFPAYQFVIAGAPSQNPEIYAEHIKGSKQVSLIFGKTYPLLMNSHAGLITSGTATLETALFQVPQVVCYKANPISYAIAKKLVKIKFISLVNLIMDKEIVKELIQHDLSTESLAQELNTIIDGAGREKMKNSYTNLITRLGGEGASKKTATLISQYMQ